MHNSSLKKNLRNLPYPLSINHSQRHAGSGSKEGFDMFEYAPLESSKSEDLESADGDVHARKPARHYNVNTYVKFLRLIFGFTIGYLTAFTVFQLLWPGPSNGPMDPFDDLFPSRRPLHADHVTGPTDERLEAYMQTVLPIPCHSHNDYWRRTPLYAALGSGCISVEADVWLFDDMLYVGHNTRSLKSESTLASMYLNPIEAMLRSVNQNSKIGNVETNDSRGVFGMDPEQTLVLMIDFKTEGVATYQKVYSELTSLREGGWLTHWNGTDRVMRPLTIVATGNRPFEEIIADQEYRDIFADAPLASLVDPEDDLSPVHVQELSLGGTPTSFDANTLRYKYNPSNSYYASMDLKRIVGHLNKYSITSSHVETLKQQIQEAKERGLVSRYWGTPRWPRTFRDYTWDLLIKSDVGLLNVDDLRAVRKRHWGYWHRP